MLFGSDSADELREILTDREISYDLLRGTGRVDTTLHVESLRPDLVLTRGSGEGIVLDRDERRVRESSIDDLTFSISLGVDGYLRQAGRQLTTTIGSGIFYTSARPMQLGLSDGYDNLMIQVDRRRMRRMTGEDIPLGTQVPVGDIGLSLLTEIAGRLLGEAQNLSVDAREHYSRALMDLLAAVILSSRSGRPVTPSGPEAMLEQLKADVFSRLDDPDLGPADLAARHNISLRYVHRLFGAEPPAAFIRRHRMLAAADLVSRTPTQPLPVSSVAIRCGFRDVGTFVRAFRRHYGCTPSEFRRLDLSLTQP